MNHVVVVGASLAGLRGVLDISIPQVEMRCRKLLAERASLSDAVAMINSL